MENKLNVIWGRNIHNQEIKEHDMLLCNKGASQHITHVVVDNGVWHREEDYKTGAVINSYEYKIGTKIAIYNENKREVDIITSNDENVIITKNHFKIDAVKLVVLNSKEKSFVEIANFEDIKKYDSLCRSCHGEGEYEVSAGSHSFFKDCECCTSIFTR